MFFLSIDFNIIILFSNRSAVYVQRIKASWRSYFLKIEINTKQFSQNTFR